MLSKIKNAVRRVIHSPLHKPTTSCEYVIFGSDYGGWPLVPHLVGPDTTIFSFGIGEDISFDLAAIREYGCKVFGFDPTPKSISWIASQDLPPTFTFFPVGLGGRDGSAKFHAPANQAHVSYSLAPKENAMSSGAISAPILRLETIISRYELTPPDILKMDIEGFEYDVIEDVLTGTLRPSMILVEFHHNMYSGIKPEQTKQTVTALQASGYKLFFVSAGGHEYGFIRGS